MAIQDNMFDNEFSFLLDAERDQSINRKTT